MKPPIIGYLIHGHSGAQNFSTSQFKRKPQMIKRDQSDLFRPTSSDWISVRRRCPLFSFHSSGTLSSILGLYQHLARLVSGHRRRRRKKTIKKYVKSLGVYIRHCSFRPVMNTRQKT